jgi:hypothetical protein
VKTEISQSLDVLVMYDERGEWHTEFWWGILLKSVRSQNRGGQGRKTLIFILEKWIMVMGAECN